MKKKEEKKAKVCPNCGNKKLEPFVTLFKRPDCSASNAVMDSMGTLGGGLKCTKCGRVTEFTSHVPCVVCSGKIVADTKIEYDPATGPPIYGPGSRRQFKEKTKGYFCTRCGIKYQFPPPPAEVIAHLKAKDSD